VNTKFKETLPLVYNKNFFEAERPAQDEAPRYSTYEAPGGKPLKFIQDDFDFSGGQSNDTAEYPFDGLWSNKRLNKKPHKLTINGHLIGKTYIEERENFLKALLVPTDDDNPAYIDLPFWGRFPVVIEDYSVSEKINEKGQCSIRLGFTRAGVTLDTRAAAIRNNIMSTAQAAQKTQLAAIDKFANKLKLNVNLTALFAATGQIKASMLSILGRIQAPQNMLNDIANEIAGLASIAADIITAPRNTALAMMNAANTIVGALAEIKNAVTSYSGNENQDSAPYRAPERNNEKAALLMFLMADSWAVNTIPATIDEQEQKSETENLYRAMALTAASQIIAGFDTPTHQEAENYWRLYEKLEESVDKNDSLLFAAIENLRMCLSVELSALELNAEKSRHFPSPLPLLVIAQYLGCDEDKLRRFNRIEDSFLVAGDITYV
jgi:hypothetical protein